MESPTTIARTVAEQFLAPDSIASLAVQPGGHINSSFTVVTRDASAGTRRWLLQRINTHVFQRPDVVMANVAAVTSFLSGHLAGSTDQARRALRLLPTRSGEPCAHGEDGAPWRCFEFIENSVCLLEPRDAQDAREAAKACGRFLRDMASYTGPRFEESLPRFHDTPLRYEQLAAALAAAAPTLVTEAVSAIDFAEARREGADSIVSALRSGALPERIAHNDAKISNVLFDSATRRSLCVIDLDTVMITSSLFDFGDLVRSMVTGRPEDERDVDAIDVRRDVFVALVDGFFDGFGEVMTRSERDLLVEGARIMTLQQGVRFLADHLAGDVYFRVATAGQNLDRARAQFRLVEQLEARRTELEAVVAAS